MLKSLIHSFLILSSGILGYAFYVGADPESQPKASAEAIAGDWRCVKIDLTGLATCETCESEPYRQLRIVGDSAYEFAYPFQYNGKWSIKDSFSLQHDTLVIGKCSYLRDRFNDKTIRALVRDSINRELLIGSWMLITRYDDYSGDEQGDGYIHVEFPFSVPKQLTLDRSAIYSRKRPRTLLIPVNGKEQEFYIEELSYRALTLITGSWREEPFRLEYTLHADVTH